MITITHDTPANDTVMEYAPVSGSFTVTTDVADVGGEFTHPTLTSVSCNVIGLTFTLSANSASYTGVFNDVFARQWKYVLEDMTRGNVPKVALIPPVHKALYAFVPPATTTIPAVLTFIGTTFDGGSPTPNVTLGTYDITIQYQNAADIAAFRDALEGATLYKQALSMDLIG